MSTTDASFGPLIRLWGVSRAQLPPSTASPELLTPFLAALLHEALPFIDSVSPKSPSAASPSPWKPKSTKSFPTSTAPIRLLERRIPSRLLAPAAAAATPSPYPRPTTDEVWACRLSLHADAPAAGTASWAEFRHAMKEAHAESEEAFTPTVVAARRALSWDCGAVAPVAAAAAGGERWGRFTLCVEEMRHAVGRPVLKDRVFPVLQMSAAVIGDGGREEEEFVVVSVTVADFEAAPEAELARRGDVVVASYASVERVRRVEGGQIEWIMATASDARGVLPMWVQTRAVPGQIAKDVGLFLGWVEEGRRKGKDTGREGEDGEDGQHTAADASARESVVAREQKALRKGWGSAGASLQ